MVAWKIRADATPSFDLSIYTLACSSLSPVVKWSDLISTPSPLRFLPTFLNGVLQTNDVFEATQTPRMLTTDRGYSYGTAAMTVRVGENGIGGIGVCCRPCENRRVD